MPTDPRPTPLEAEPDDVPRLDGVRRAWAGAGAGARRVVALLVALTLVGTGLAVWWGLSSTVGKPTWNDLAYDVRGPREVLVRFQLTRPEDSAVRCTVIAQETGHATVGRAVVDVPPGPPATGVHEVTVRTTSLAVIGRVRTCVTV